MPRWGDGVVGKQQISHPVCKGSTPQPAQPLMTVNRCPAGKFQPWRGTERQYGCFRHHKHRKTKIDKFGFRKGWESFEQWPEPPCKPKAEAVEQSAAIKQATGSAGEGTTERCTKRKRGPVVKVAIEPKTEDPEMI